MGFDLEGDNPFNYCRQKGEIGEGFVVVGDVRVKARLFEDRCDS